MCVCVEGVVSWLPKDYIIAPWVVALQYVCENMAEQVELEELARELRSNY